MQWTLNLTSHGHVRRRSLRLDPEFVGCCFSSLAHRLQTCSTAQALPENCCTFLRISSSAISISETVIGGKERMGVERIGSLNFPCLLNLCKFSRYRKSHATFLKRNHQDSPHLPHSATDLDLSPLVARQPDWQQTCGNAYFRSSYNEALTCCLTKTRIGN